MESDLTEEVTHFWFIILTKRMMKLLTSKKRIKIEQFRSSRRSRIINVISLFAATILCPIFTFVLYQSGTTKIYFYAILVYSIYYGITIYFLLVLKKKSKQLTTIFLLSFYVITYFSFVSIYNSKFELIELIYFLVFYCFNLFLIQRTLALVVFVVLVNSMLIIGMYVVDEVLFSYSKLFVLTTFTALGICAISVRYLREEQYQSIKGYSKYLSAILNNPGIGYFLLKIEDKIRVIDLNEEAFNQFRIANSSKDEIEKIFRSNITKTDIEKIWKLKSGENFIKNIKLREFNSDLFIEVTINLIIINSEKYWFGQAKNVTKEVQIQQEIQRSSKLIKENENKYRTLFEESNDAILLIDKELVIDANKRAIELFGALNPKQKLIGSKPYRIGINSSARWKEKFAEIVTELNQKKSIKFDWEFFGENAIIETEFFITKTVVNNKNYFQCIIHDNTQRNTNIKQIEENNHNLQSILESNPQGIVILDDNSIVYSNSATKELFENPLVLGDLFSGKSGKKLNNALSDKILKGDRRILRLTKVKDEKELFLDTTIVATSYQSKEVVMLIFNDVTAQKDLSKEQLRAEVAEENSKKLYLEVQERVRAEKKLQEEFLRSKAILDSSSNTHLLTLNTKFEITGINSHIIQAAKDLMDVKLFQGQEVFSVFERILNDSQLDYSKRILNVVRKGKDFHGTICLTCKKNTNIWWEVYLSPIKNILGRITEISIIAHDVSEKILADQEIMESLREKEILLKEIHHRVKNNLQVISSILNLQSSFVEDDQTQDILMESRNRVRTMAIIHENLYRTEDFSSIDFGEYLSNLVRNLVASYRVNKKIDLKLNVKSVRLNIDQAIPCGLLVNEVVSNALKYAWKEDQEGKLTVKLIEGQGKEVNLEISDNGKGLPDEFEKINSDTLGLQLICTLVEQLDGELDVKGAPGTNYFIKFERI